MDQLSTAEKAEVESYLQQFPELRSDLREIERSLELYASTTAIQTPAGLKERVLDDIRHEFKGDATLKPRSGGIWPAVAAVFALGLLLFGYLFYQKNNDVQRLQDEMTSLRDTCQTTTTQLTQQLDILRQLTLPNNKILTFTATPGFASTDLYLHTNKETKKNFIQVRNLPSIAANQDFQLWAIKPNQAPQPLNVFDVPASGLIEVAYVDGTDTYAITIEPAGGVTSPTLANLIGTVSVAGI